MLENKLSEKINVSCADQCGYNNYIHNFDLVHKHFKTYEDMIAFMNSGKKELNNDQYWKNQSKCSFYVERLDFINFVTNTLYFGIRIDN